VLHPSGVDSREVMEIFCEDFKLNLGPAYLRPGFAYGGSCLPKDLRSLLHLARVNGVDAPLLAGTAVTNEMVVRDVVERVIETGKRRVALLGLSFKADTDDLRESPSVDLAERLIGKGFDVRIYDPIINPDKLVGANLRDVEARFHLSPLLASTAEEALEGAEVVLVASSAIVVTEALLTASPAHLIDLSGRLDAEIERLPGYSGVGW
jgi:GDP-mannose 6-dehydrogenase